VVIAAQVAIGVARRSRVAGSQPRPAASSSIGHGSILANSHSSGVAPNLSAMMSAQKSFDTDDSERGGFLSRNLNFNKNSRRWRLQGDGLHQLRVAQSDIGPLPA
jgi:hypothetical protein